VLNFTLNFKGKNLKYLTQFSIILAISFVAEILAALIPVKIPASIYGLVIMLLALIFKLIKVAQIRETVSFFMQIMPVIFIPAGAAIIIAGDKLRESFFAIIAITAISTVAVIAASGAVTQIFYKIALNRLKRKLYAAAHNEFSEAAAPTDRGASGGDSVIGIANGVAGGGTDSAAKSVPKGADGGPVGTDALKGSASADTSTGFANTDTIAGVTGVGADTSRAGDDAITGSLDADAIADSADAGEIIDEMLKHEALSQEDER
jgi:lrgA family protein